MKKLALSLSIVAVATFLAVASQSSGGTFTLSSEPVFTPNESFTDNSIQAEVISNPPGVDGDLVRISGGATIVPPPTDVATIDIAGSYSANRLDTVSIAYSFTADLNSVNPVQYTLRGTLMDSVLGTITLPDTSDTITNGLHQYSGIIDVPISFLIGSSGTFTAQLELNFAAPTAASGTLDLNIQQIDLQLAPSSATLPPPAVSQNISTRSDVQTGDNVLIGGFIITGTQAKQVVIRAIGPSLVSAVNVPLADPILELHDSSGALIATNDNWMDNSTDDQTVLTDAGLAPTDDLESALVATLDPDPVGYTAIVRGVGDTTGVALVEVYDLDLTTDGQLANISTRGFVETGENILIGGFIIGPDTSGAASIVVRAIGPSLAGQDVADPLADPTLSVFNADGVVIATNDNWADSADAQTITDDGLDPSDAAESALLLIPGPGAYTVQVSGVGDTSGVGLVEIYNLQ